jgi:hypothetical protein
MKNVTVTLPEDAARWARIRAAQLNTSVSRMLGDMLREMMETDRAYESAMNEYLSRAPQVLSQPAQTYPRREELHDRAMGSAPAEGNRGGDREKRSRPCANQ